MGRISIVVISLVLAGCGEAGHEVGSSRVPAEESPPPARKDVMAERGCGTTKGREDSCGSAPISGAQSSRNLEVWEFSEAEITAYVDKSGNVVVLGNQSKSDDEKFRIGRERAERMLKVNERALAYLRVCDQLTECRRRILLLGSERKRVGGDPMANEEELKRIDEQVKIETALSVELDAKLKELGTEDVLMAAEAAVQRSRNSEPMPFGKSAFGPWDTGSGSPRP